MVRPQKRRTISNEPAVTYYKPRGVPLQALEENAITIDELESLHLADAQGLSQKAGAQRMGVHQSTFSRMLSKARQKIADALCNGKAIRIQGGAYDLPGNQPKNTLSTCACLGCGHETPHVRGQPCSSMTCPHCGHVLIRMDTEGKTP